MRAGTALCAPKLRLINHAFVVVQRAFRPILAALAGRRHPADDRIDSRTNIDVGAVLHQRDLIPGRKLVAVQWAPLLELRIETTWGRTSTAVRCTAGQRLR